MENWLIWLLAIIISLGVLGFTLRKPPVITDEPVNWDKLWNDTSVFGPTVLTAEQLDSYARTRNPNTPALGQYYVKWGKYYGIRGDVVYAQSIHETGFFKYGGDVVPEQNNFAGIGTTGGGVKGHFFKTPEEGVIAQFQHVWAYSTTDPLPSYPELVDPRYHLVKRGVAPTWPDFDGKWAVPGKGYGQRVLNYWKEMVRYHKIYDPYAKN